MIESIIVVLLMISALFFFAGTVAVIRFPDVYTRLHGLTKADNLGLGFLVLALAVHAGDVAVAAKLLVIWIAAMTFGSLACHLIARREDRKARELEHGHG
jgi:multicomponent Na+:H+ antiporter subunit G